MNIPTSYLAALLHCVAKHDIRWYLNGIRIDGQYLVATDGHRLAFYRLEKDSGLNVIIPRDDIERALKIHKKQFGKSNLPIEITENTIGRLTYKPLELASEKQFYWRKVLPKKITDYPAAPVGFQGQYVAEFAEMAQIINGSNGVTLHPTQENGVIIVDIAVPDMFCLLMPLITENKDYYPAWVSDEIRASHAGLEKEKAA